MTAAPHIESATTPSIRPVPLHTALLLFGVPGATIYLATHLAVPRMVATGMPLVWAWTAAVVGPTVANAVVVLAHYFRTERPTFRDFVDRFRLHRPHHRILWVVPLTVVAIVAANELLSWTVPLLRNVSWLAPPEVVPEVFGDVYEALEGHGATFMGEPATADTLWLVPFWLVFWVGLAVLGEEIVWRGYILPAHERRFGRWAWLLNGLLWNVPFHLYTLHNLFSDMPLYLLLPFVVSRMRNTWYGIATHALLVSLALVVYAQGVQS